MTDGPTDRPAAALPGRRRGRVVSEDLRGPVVAAVLCEGMSIAAAARRFGLAASTAGVWVKRFRERGHLQPDKRGGSASRIERERERILRVLGRRPKISMYGLRDALAAEGVTFSAIGVQRFLKRHGLDLKSRLAARQRGRGSGRK